MYVNVMGLKLELQTGSDTCMKAQSEVSLSSSLLSPQPAAVPLSPRRHGDDIDDEDDRDLNKTLGVQRFQQILSPSSWLPAEQHRPFNQEDLEGELTNATQSFLLHRECRSLTWMNKTSSHSASFYPIH